MNSPSVKRDPTGNLYLVPSRSNKDCSSDRSPFNQPRGRAFILSADDDPLVLTTRRMILERSGYEVLNAADGRQVLDIFARHHIDLAILDYRMPQLDGGAAAREMKRIRPLLPIILVSGEVVDDEVKACSDSFLTKGQNPKLLLGEIKRLLAPSKFCVRAAAGF